MPNRSIQVRCLSSATEVAAETAREILAAADSAIAVRGRFALVLAGGRTPLAAYTLLVGQAADWDRWHIFLGDERCLEPSDAGRNSVAATRTFLDTVPIPTSNIHWIPAELGAEAAAAAYQRVIAAFLPFDLVLLGMGEDGHTASLFPGQPVPDGPLVIPVQGAPKPPPERVSLTPRALSDCLEMLILITGPDKREAVAAWRRGEDLPVARVASLSPAKVLMDEGAAGGCGGLEAMPALD
ncbi:MAG: 6-phosphogluconolactonase [Bdellovibrio bacteriovorus]